MWSRGVLIAIVVVVPCDVITAQKPNYCSFNEDYFEYVPKTITIMDKKDKKSGGILSYLNPMNIFSRRTRYEIKERTTMVPEKKTRMITTCCRGFVHKNGDCVSKNSSDAVKSSLNITTSTTIAVSPLSITTSSTTSVIPLQESPIATSLIPQNIDVNLQKPTDVIVSTSSQTSTLSPEFSTSSAVQIASSTESPPEVTSSKTTQEVISATEQKTQLPPTLEALTFPISINTDITSIPKVLEMTTSVEMSTEQESPSQTASSSKLIFPDFESPNKNLSSTEEEKSVSNTITEINLGFEMTDVMYESSNLDNVVINPKLDNVPLIDDNNNRLENEENEITTITIRRDGNFAALAVLDPNVVIISNIDEIDEETKSPTVEIDSNNGNKIDTFTPTSPPEITTVKNNKRLSWLDKLLQILRYFLTSWLSINFNNPITTPTITVSSNN